SCDPGHLPSFPTRRSSDLTLHWREVPDPVPRSGDVLIKVHTAGVNRADLLQRNGLHAVPPGESDVLGLEVSGEVVELGPGVEGRSEEHTSELQSRENLVCR